MPKQMFRGYVRKITWEDADPIPRWFVEAHDLYKSTGNIKEVEKYFERIFQATFIPSNIGLNDDRIKLPDDDLIGSNISVNLRGFSDRGVPVLDIGAYFTFSISPKFKTQEDFSEYQEENDFLDNALSFDLNLGNLEYSDEEMGDIQIYISSCSYDERGFLLDIDGVENIN